MNNDIVRALGAIARRMQYNGCEHQGVAESNEWRELAYACDQYIGERAPVEKGGAA